MPNRRVHYFDIIKIVIRILQGNAVTQNVLRGVVMYHLFANFLWSGFAENYENRLACVKVISNNKVDPLKHSVEGILERQAD